MCIRDEESLLSRVHIRMCVCHVYTSLITYTHTSLQEAVDVCAEDLHFTRERGRERDARRLSTLARSCPLGRTRVVRIIGERGGGLTYKIKINTLPSVILPNTRIVKTTDHPCNMYQDQMGQTPPSVTRIVMLRRYVNNEKDSIKM